MAIILRNGLEALHF